MVIKKYCNICGRELNEYDIKENYSVHKLIGYGSKYDGSFMHLNICIECMDELIDKCKIKPINTL